MHMVMRLFLHPRQYLSQHVQKLNTAQNLHQQSKPTRDVHTHGQATALPGPPEQPLPRHSEKLWQIYGVKRPSLLLLDCLDPGQNSELLARFLQYVRASRQSLEQERPKARPPVANSRERFFMVAYGSQRINMPEKLHVHQVVLLFKLLQPLLGLRQPRFHGKNNAASLFDWKVTALGFNERCRKPNLPDFSVAGLKCLLLTRTGKDSLSQKNPVTRVASTAPMLVPWHARSQDAVTRWSSPLKSM